MNVAYIDTSCLVALAFRESGAGALARRLAHVDQLVSSNLLEAELRAVLAREARDWDDDLVGRIGWLLPDRALGPEIARVLAAGYVRGADCWHLATALYLAGQTPRDVEFVTLDRSQGIVAKVLGFR